METTSLRIEKGESYLITVPSDSESVKSSATVWLTGDGVQDVLNSELTAGSTLTLGPYFNIATFRVERIGNVTIAKIGEDFSTPMSMFGDLKIAGNTITDAGDGVNLNNSGNEIAGINVNGVTYDVGLRVNDIGNNSPAQFVSHKHSTTLQCAFIGSRSNSDDASHGDVTNGMPLVTYYGAGWAGSSYKLFGGITFYADSTGTISNTSAPGKITFDVTPDAGLTPQTWLQVTNNKIADFKGAVNYTEQSVTPDDPSDGVEARTYVKDDKFVIQYNDGGTIRYKYLDLTGTGVTWTHTTTAP